MRSSETPAPNGFIQGVNFRTGVTSASISPRGRILIPAKVQEICELKRKKYYRLFLKPGVSVLAITFHEKSVEGAYKFTRVCGTGYIEARRVLSKAGLQVLGKGEVPLQWDDSAGSLLADLGKCVRSAAQWDPASVSGDDVPRLAIPSTPGQTAEVLEGNEGTPPGWIWSPVVGGEASSLQRHLKIPEESRSVALQEAVDLLARSARPGAANSSVTGLAVLEVQGGKTTSFTVATALARDNKFKLVIIIAGTKLELYSQSKERLYRDLQINTRHDRNWRCFDNPTPNQADRIEKTLASWDDPHIHDSQKPTVLITVMKQHKRLANLIELVKNLKVQSIPALIIDDEADQASLNNLVSEGNTSTTYRRLLELKAALPNHTFLQYTATPQAPLLINIIDVLSPSFAKVLSLGEGYVGAQKLFVEHPNLVRTIPVEEMPGPDNYLTAPPESLKTAMKLFFVGVAAGFARNEDLGKNRSMMVHPSQLTDSHEVYFRWVEETKRAWERLLIFGDPHERGDLLAEFEEAHQDLAQTVSDMPSFEDITRFLLHSLRETEVLRINSKIGGRAPIINWRNNYAHILVGGQAMDRGFTVEGLTVTYMPRGLGTGTADTIQQRGRFFGYKGSYIGYLRIFLDAGVRDAYEKYVMHQEDIQSRLRDHLKSGEPLSNWKRAFFLDKSLRPTRNSVIDIEYSHERYAETWFSCLRPNYSPEALAANRDVVASLKKVFRWEADEGHPRRTASQRHMVCHNASLRSLYDYLIRFRIGHPSEAQRYYGILLQIGRYLEEDPSATATVYFMGTGVERDRTVDKDGYFPNLFQGADPSRHKKGEEVRYPGDRLIRAANQLTVQIHTINLIDSEGVHRVDAVPTLGIWLPKNMARDCVVQL